MSKRKKLAPISYINTVLNIDGTIDYIKQRARVLKIKMPVNTLTFLKKIRKECREACDTKPFTLS